MKKTAIIIGATGATGSLLLQILLKDENYECIKLFSRRSVGFQHIKIKEFLGNIIELQDFKTDFTGDEVFCCIGTTKAKTKDEIIYKSIDFGIPAKASQLAKENGISFFAVVSAMGANAQSNIFYNKTKGEMEHEVLAQKIACTYILRPSLIKAQRTEKRLGEDVGNFIFQIINPLMIGKFKNYRAIKAETIAKALYILAQKRPKQKILLSSETKEVIL